MKRFILLLLLALSTASALAAGFTGQYSGEVNGTPTTLMLRQSGNQLSGVMDASGYRYEISGQAQGRNVRGKLRDTRLGGVLDMDARLDGNTLILTMHAVNQFTGQRQSVPLRFVRGASTSRPAQATAPGGNIDSRIVGLWRNSDTYNSGNFSMTSEIMLQLRVDGTYSHGNARTFGGGPGSSLSSSSGDATHGRWRVRDKVIYILDQASGQWEPYARYGLHENSMLFIFPNKKRQLWNRVR